MVPEMEADFFLVTLTQRSNEPTCQRFSHPASDVRAAPPVGMHYCSYVVSFQPDGQLDNPTAKKFQATWREEI
jgi:hypothetical protein